MKLFEVKIQDPETGEWFEKDKKHLEIYFKKFNKKYFNNELPMIKIVPMNFVEAGSSLCLGETKSKFQANTRTIEYDIKINTDYISSFEELRIVMVHEMIHLWVNVNRKISDEQWNEALNYGLYCNKKSIEPDIVKFQKCLGIDPAESHSGKWLEKANELNNKFEELNGELAEYYNCTVDKDSAENLQNKINVFVRMRNNENTLFVYADDDYKIISAIITRGTSRQNSAVGEWYKIKIKNDELYSFVENYSNKMCNIENFELFKEKYVESIKFLNNVQYVGIDENFIYFPNDCSFTVVL